MDDLEEIASTRRDECSLFSFSLSRVRIPGEPLVLYIRGNFDVYSAIEFRTFLMEHGLPYDSLGTAQDCSHQKVNRPDLFVDLDGCEHMDSVGLGKLIALKRLADRDRAQYKVISNSPVINRVFNITGANRIFEVYDSLDKA